MSIFSNSLEAIQHAEELGRRFIFVFAFSDAFYIEYWVRDDIVDEHVFNKVVGERVQELILKHRPFQMTMRELR